MKTKPYNNTAKSECGNVVLSSSLFPFQSFQMIFMKVETYGNEGKLYNLPDGAHIFFPSVATLPLSKIYAVVLFFTI